MQNQNRNGPRRMGRMNGRGRGPCGGRMGRRGNFQLPDRTEEKEALETALQALEENRKSIEARLKELE